MKVTDKYVFFWGSALSNWDQSEILVTEGDLEITFNTSEHYFMYLKAIYFGDLTIAKKIIESETPKEAKKLGRQIEGFSDNAWAGVREEMMMKALRAKFGQSKKHRDYLMSPMFKGKDFVEASPYDRIWGIGLSESDPCLLDTSRWGLNLLGKCLTRVRKELSGC